MKKGLVIIGMMLSISMSALAQRTLWPLVVYKGVEGILSANRTSGQIWQSNRTGSMSTGVIPGLSNPRPIFELEEPTKKRDELWKKIEENTKLIKESVKQREEFKKTIEDLSKRTRYILYENVKRDILSGVRTLDAAMCLGAACSAQEFEENGWHDLFIMWATYSPTLTMNVINDLTPTQRKHLKKDIPGLVRYIVERDYIERAKNGVEDSSKSMPEKEAAKYIKLCNEYAPNHVKLANLVISGDISNLQLLKTAIEPLADNDSVYKAPTKEYLLVNVTNSLYLKEDDKEMLESFRKSPLKEYADSNANVLLMLCDCAYGKEEYYDRYVKYNERAYELDPEKTGEYNEKMWNSIWTYFIENPSDTAALHEFIDSLSGDILAVSAWQLFEGWLSKIAQLDGPMTDFEWETIDDYPAEEQPYFRALFETANYINLDSITIPEIQQYLKTFRDLGILFPNYEQSAKDWLISLTEELLGDPNADKADVAKQCFLRAYVEAHGLDTPREAVKWLTEYEPVITNSEDEMLIVNTYNYLSQAYLKLGKKKQAKKYAALAEKALSTISTPE